MARKSRTQEIADILRDEILRGQYRTGERLPSERDLAQRFEVNRGIARVALKKLEQLGLADIQSAGARVAPLDHASLDVIGYLLDLQHPPDRQLAAQVLEAYRGIMALAVRFGIERASDEQITRARFIVDQLISAPLDEEEFHDLQIEFSKLFVDASQNLVLKLIRRGVSINFVSQLYQEGAQMPPRSVMRASMEKLRKALEERDSIAASQALDAGMALVHERVLAALGDAQPTTGATAGTTQTPS